MKNAYEIRGEVTAIFLNSPRYGVMETLIDTDDLPKVQLIESTWYSCWRKSLNGFYAAANVRCDKGKRTLILLHRFLTDAPPNIEVDHFNGKTLDNRRSKNLRFSSRSENMQNRRGAASNSKSGVRGVIWDKQKQKWRAGLFVNGKNVHVGFFDDIKVARRAVSLARIKYMPFTNEQEV